jgi:hypothetical protein
MTTAVKAVEILTTLAEDPHFMFFPWQLDVHDTAAGMAKSIHLNGCLPWEHDHRCPRTTPDRTALHTTPVCRDQQQHDKC